MKGLNVIATVSGIPTTDTPGAEAGVPMETISAAELAELLKQEAVIRNGLKTFIEVGRAFAEIKKQALYRAKYRTFAEYCEAEWEMSDRHALNYEKAAGVVDALGAAKFLLLPQTESQARPLLKLPQSEWAGAWDEVVSTLHGKLTASHVTEVVQRRLNRLNGHGTEVVAKGERAEVRGESRAPIDVPDLSTKEKRIEAQLDKAREELRVLKALTGVDSVETAVVLQAILALDELQLHIDKKEEFLEGRRHL